MTRNTELDDIIWRSLSGDQARFSTGTAVARRYAAGLSPIAAFADRVNPAVEALTPFCAPGEHLYCEGWPGPCPDGWRVEEESTMFRMVWEGAVPLEPGPVPPFSPLRSEHGQQAFELAQLTRPGPFGPRTIELGDYFGVFDGARLVSMAGERFASGRYREISGICTHPEYQGRGYARRLAELLIRRQSGRGEIPFLHVMRENTRARGLYERMGFRVYSEPPVRVIMRH